MATTFYAYRGREFDAERPHFQEMNVREYYDGELDILSGNASVDMTIQRGLTAPFPVNFLRCTARLAFRRSWNHLRTNKRDVCVVWFVKKGELSVGQRGKTCRVTAGQYIITRSDIPLRIEVRPAASHGFEALHMIVPRHALHSDVTDGAGIGVPITATAGDGRVAQDILDLLFAHGDAMSADVSVPLIGALLKSIEHSVRALGGPVRQNLTIGDQRMMAIESYIMMHLSDPGISAASVARGCGISTRYLCYLLKAHGTSFSKVIWDERLAAAGRWLREPAMHNHSIGAIAYMAGYKSAAHFSRMFKRRMNCSPRAFRQGAETGPSGAT